MQTTHSLTIQFQIPTIALTLQYDNAVFTDDDIMLGQTFGGITQTP